ncbi:MAG TPA: CheR family methyltransferase [Clostridia bacterium]|nr:CheR family methyltransferase [Clostridia bacterium]
MGNDLSLQQLVNSLSENRGLNLRGYKQSTLERRLRKRMFAVNINTYSEYLERLREDPREVNELLDTVLINVTEFFRDPQAWSCLRSDVLPLVLKGIRPGDSFRVWSAGTASGEEAYSLAILMAEFLGPSFSDFDVKIYATDIDEHALSVARRGEYSADRLRRLHPELRDKYFQGDSVLKISRDIRRMVIFGRSNLVSDAPISHCNLAICRNVLIYFDSGAQNQIIGRLHYALEPGGILFLGKAESRLSHSHLFQTLSRRWRIFQKIPKNQKTYPSTRFNGEVAVNDSTRETNVNELDTLRSQQRQTLDAPRTGVVLNEELETANEELQSTNEELETTNEELQSLNEELEKMNEELEERTRELNAITTRYAEVLQQMPWPVILVDGDEKIQLWNAASQRLFGAGATSVVGVDIDQLPLHESVQRAIVRRYRWVLEKRKPSILRDQNFRVDGIHGVMEVHFTPILHTGSEIEGVLIMFSEFASEDGARHHGSRGLEKPTVTASARAKKSVSPRDGDLKAR